MSNRPETIRFARRRLPHWEVADGRYFVTVHLRGAIPAAGLERVKRLREQLEIAIANGQQGFAERQAVFREIEYWLDCAPRVSHLADRRVAVMMTDAIDHRVRQGIWTMFRYVIMPNHIHLFFKVGATSRVAHPSEVGATSRVALDSHSSPLAEPPGAETTDQRTLDSVLNGFKRWTGHRAGEILNLDGTRFWQREWFDHWSRSADEDEKIESYIRANPAKAGLTPNGETWPWLR